MCKWDDQYTQQLIMEQEQEQITYIVTLLIKDEQIYFNFQKNANFDLVVTTN